MVLGTGRCIEILRPALIEALKGDESCDMYVYARKVGMSSEIRCVATKMPSHRSLAFSIAGRPSYTKIFMYLHRKLSNIFRSELLAGHGI